MTDNEKSARFALVTGEGDSDMAAAYLDTAAAMILERRFPLTESRDALEVPVRYDGLQVDIAVALWARRGAEGESAHSENGISRTYDPVEDYLKRVVPCIGYEDGER